MTEITRPALRYHGGKFRLAPWILEFFPPHRVYCEPFGGGASVLLLKDRSYAEVYNDLDLEVVNFFRVLRDPEQAAALERAIYLTPFSRDEFIESYGATDDPVEAARRTAIRTFMGFGTNTLRHNRTGFRAKANRQTQPAQIDWVKYPDCIGAFAERLRGVVIENRDALEVMTQQDGEETLFYVDPPYPHETRSAIKSHNDKAYRHEMSTADHMAMAEIVRELKGMVVLSGYPCELYDKRLFADWARQQRQVMADGGRERTEVVWVNRACLRALYEARGDLFGELFA
jgi:DNA adenine methylase